MGKEATFFCFRYFEVKRQNSLFESGSPSLMRRVIERCKKAKIETVSADDKRSGLIFVKKLDEDLVLLKQYKQTHVTVQKFNPSEEDIVPIEDDSLPFIFVIVFLGQRQMIAFQKKTTVFRDAQAAKKAFLKILKAHFDDPSISLSIDEISTKRRFWQIVERAEKIYSLKLKLRSPNLFGGAFKINSFLKAVNSETNNDSMTLELESANGDLIIEEEDYGDALSYIDAGGGSWELTCQSALSRKRDRIKSTSDVSSFNIPVPEEMPKLLEDTEAIVNEFRMIDEASRPLEDV